MGCIPKVCAIIDKSITDIRKDERRRPVEVKGVTRGMADSRWEGCRTRVYMRLEGSHGSYFSLFNGRQVKRDERKRKKTKERNEMATTESCSRETYHVL